MSDSESVWSQLSLKKIILIALLDHFLQKFQILWVFPARQIKPKSHFYAKNSIFKLNLAIVVLFCKNTLLHAMKMCSDSFKVNKHIESNPKPKRLISNITKMILDKFFKIKILHFQQNFDVFQLLFSAENQKEF